MKQIKDQNLLLIAFGGKYDFQISETHSEYNLIVFDEMINRIEHSSDQQPNIFQQKWEHQ